MNQPIQLNGQDKPENPSGQLSPFDAIRKTDDAGLEYWSSRDLSRVFGYTQYTYLEPVIEKAKIACANSNQCTDDHFMQMNEMIKIGKSAQREFNSVHLTRYACYLIAMEADSSKPIVAQAKTYFAIQTRRQEVADAQLSEYQHQIKRRYMTKARSAKMVTEYFKEWDAIADEPVKAERQSKESAQAKYAALLEEHVALQKQNIALLQDRLANNQTSLTQKN